MPKENFLLLIVAECKIVFEIFLHDRGIEKVNYSGAGVSRQFQFHHGRISISLLQFQFHHHSLNFVQGNFNFITIV